jgi:hypothetical protein
VTPLPYSAATLRWRTIAWTWASRSNRATASGSLRTDWRRILIATSALLPVSVAR